MDVHHRCLGYPITILVASDAINTGSIVAPSVVGAYTIHHGRGHPLNKTKVLYPQTPNYLPDDATFPPTQSIIQRRALLLGAVEALTGIKEQYLDMKRNVCVHVCCTSKYLPQIWLKWIPEWSDNGWPGETQSIMTTTPKTRSRHMSNASSATKRMSKPLNRRDSRASMRSNGRNSVMSGGGESIFSNPDSLASTGLFDQRSGKPIDDDLIRQLTDLHAHFEHAMLERRGACSITVVKRLGNIAAETARDAVAMASTSTLVRPPSGASTPRASHSRANSNATTLVGGYPRRNSLGSSAGSKVVTSGKGGAKSYDAAAAKTLPRSFSKPPYPAPAAPGSSPEKGSAADTSSKSKPPVLPAILPFRPLERTLSHDTNATGGEDTFEDAIDRIDEEEETTTTTTTPEATTPATTKAAPALTPAALSSGIVEDPRSDAEDVPEEGEEGSSDTTTPPAVAAPATAAVAATAAAPAAAKKSNSTKRFSKKPSKSSKKEVEEPQQESDVITRDFHNDKKAASKKTKPSKKETKKTEAAAPLSPTTTTTTTRTQSQSPPVETERRPDPMTAYRAPKNPNSSLFSRHRSYSRVNPDGTSSGDLLAEKRAQQAPPPPIKKSFFQRLLELP